MPLDPQTTAWLDQEDAHLAAVIREHRWAVQYVGPGDAPDQPSFAYTIGLFGLDGRHQALGPIRRAMDIGCDKKLHDGSNLKTPYNE